MDRDARSWIARLEAEGELKRVTAKVDWNEEIGEVQRQNALKQGPALLFENIKDHEHTWCRKLFCGGLGTLGRIALMMGLPKDASLDAMVQLLRRRLREPVVPTVVKTGPVKENVLRGEDVDLFQIPVPKWHRFDAGRYINTWYGMVTADPDTGRSNVGVYRGMIGGKNRINVHLVPAQHWGIHFRKYQEAGKPMPVAMVYGADPAMEFVAGLAMPMEEYSVMGSIMQEPVPLVKCETSDLKVPANAEIVIEGTISTDPSSYEMEGPYGEEAGFYSRPRKRPVIRVDCITFRNDPIYRGSINETGPLSLVGAPAIMWNTLEQQGIPGVRDVAVGAFLYNVVKIHKTYQGQAKHVAAALWGSRMAITMVKIIIVVDDDRDVDIHDPVQLHKTIRTHLDPSRGLVIFPMQLGPPTDAALSPEAQDEMEWGQALQSKLLIDATVDWTTHPRNEAWGGQRLSPDVNEPAPVVSDLVRARWHEYGI